MYLLITNEFKNIIADIFFGNWIEKIMPRLIGYAALDSVDIDEYCAYNIKLYTCVSGHILVVVYKDTLKNVDKFIDKIDKLLMNEIISPYFDNNELATNFFEEANKIYESLG